MSFFTSKREQRLWFWTIAVVAAIYSTLGLARSLAELLSQRGLDEILFILGCLLVLATVLTQGLKTRPSSTEIVTALGVAAAYLLLFARMTIPTERSHLVEYGVVAIFIHEALMERANQGRRVSSPAILAILATSLVGTADESIQAFLPGRVFDLRDILFNALAAFMAISASKALKWARQRSISKK